MSHASAASKAEQATVVLVRMPFGPIRSPALGLSLLQASLTDIPTKILYSSLDFADLIGEPTYRLVAHEFPVFSQVGEWIFRPALFEESEEEAGRYLDEVLDVESESGLLSPSVVASLLEVRSQIEDFLIRCRDEILALRPRIVGFESSFQQQLASLALASRLKRAREDLVVLLGGANCTGVMGKELARQFSFVDFVVSGEADEVVPELVKRVLDRGTTVGLSGVWSSPAGPEAESIEAETHLVDSLDSLPYPDYTEFFERWRLSPLSREEPPRLMFEASRGCWWGESHHCTFCGLNGDTMSYRAKSPKRALAELAFLLDRHPGLSVTVVDRILDMSYFRTVLPELSRRERPAKLFFEVKSNLRKEQVRLLREAGVLEILPGIESFSDEILTLMKKGVTGLQNVQLLKWCAEFGVWPSWYFVWGFPREPKSEYRRMAELVPWLAHLPPPTDAMPVELVRFSPNFDRALELGFEDVRPRRAYDFLYPIPEASRANLAWFFTAERPHPGDIEGYTASLAGAIKTWQSCYETSELFFVDKGTELWLMDMRPAARRPLTILQESARSWYLACDGVRSLSALAKTVPGASPEQVEDCLAPLVEDGLMLRDGDRVLALAVPAGTKVSPPGPDWAAGSY